MCIRIVSSDEEVEDAESDGATSEKSLGKGYDSVSTKQKLILT